MDYSDMREWDEVTEEVFNDLSHLLDESGVRIEHESHMTGPGGDWDIDTLVITGCDSNEQHVLLRSQSTPGGRSGTYADLDDFAAELAYYIADAQGAEVEEEDIHTFIVWF